MSALIRKESMKFGETEDNELGVFSNERFASTVDTPNTTHIDVVAEEWQTIAHVLDYVFFFLYILCVILCIFISFRQLIFLEELTPL